MIPKIQYIKDLTEYSKLVKEAIELSGDNKNIIPLHKILDRINENINQKADACENEYLLLFGVSKCITDIEVINKLILNKEKRCKILLRIFRSFGYNAEYCLKNGHPGLKISW